MPNPPVSAVVNNIEERRFEITVEDRAAFVTYSRHGDRLILIHTEVPVQLEGRGIATALARAALEFARAERLQVDPRCSFIASFIRRNPQYVDVVLPERREQVTAR